MSARGLAARKSRRSAGIAARMVSMVAAMACAFVLASVPAECRITKLVISTAQAPTFDSASFAHVGPYEKLVGRAFGEIDPNDPRNAIVTDVASAPRNAGGMVEYSMDV